MRRVPSLSIILIIGGIPENEEGGVPSLSIILIIGGIPENEEGGSPPYRSRTHGAR